MQDKRKATKYDLKRVSKYTVADCCTLHIGNFHSSIFQFPLLHLALIQFGPLQLSNFRYVDAHLASKITNGAMDHA